jgi:tRNA pseudouridine38-40 synthase
MEAEKSLKKRPRKAARSNEPEIKNFRLVVAYRGTHYKGWQKQAVSDGPDTVQEMLEKAARIVLKRRKVVVHGSGRTDAGVHARAQVAHLRAAVDLPASTLIKAINAHLPEDVRVLRMEECPGFHSQLDVESKTYRYFILNTHTGKDPIHWPFLRPYTWFVSYPLDLPAMGKALFHLVGEHDFRSFQNRGTPLESTVREILEARLIEHKLDELSPPWMPGPEFQARLLEIRVTGTGFLKQMVRTIVGTVVEIGRGRFGPDEIQKILEKKDRNAGGMTAPAQGLFLDKVVYKSAWKE